MIALHQVGVTFPGGKQALAGVDLEIPRGQFCVILGPSGSGKSTLLNLMNGMVRPTTGSVSRDGSTLEARNLQSAQRRTGMIHQRFNLVGRLSVLDNVLTGSLARISTARALLGLFGASRRHQACQLLAGVGLREEHLYRRAANLSGGEQQRVGIARAFLERPELILADEPVASLDPRIGVEIMTLTRRLSQAYEATVVCSLHQVDLARRFADRIVALRGGQVVFDGAAETFNQDTAERVYQSGGRTSLGPAA